MNTHDPQLTLRRILDANAVFSATSGLYFFIAAKPLAEFLGTSPLVMTILAIVLFGYAALITFNTSRPVIHRNFVLLTILSDSLWVLLSVLVLVLALFNLSADAKWAIGITAICVDLFATLQFLEWRKLR